KIDKSIAVLPFENYSDDKENAYFADGIQDDILTNLSKIGDLKVISRTSVMPYRGKEKNVREIAQALGVSAILEGSVRKSGNRVRVNVQLINALNDEHIWSDVYDRDLTDVFAIQTDLAKKIAQELHARLSPIEKEQMTRKPTENGEAYLAFVQAHNFHRDLEDFPKLKQAEQLYERALQLDPNFALAAASYSRLQSWIYHTYEPSADRREKSRALAVAKSGFELPDAAKIRPGKQDGRSRAEAGSGFVQSVVDQVAVGDVGKGHIPDRRTRSGGAHVEADGRRNKNSLRRFARPDSAF